MSKTQYKIQKSDIKTIKDVMYRWDGKKKMCNPRELELELCTLHVLKKYQKMHDFCQMMGSFELICLSCKEKSEVERLRLLLAQMYFDH